MSTKVVFSRVVWGMFFLLAAALVLVSQIHPGYFAKFGAGSIIILIVSLMLILYSVVNLRFALIPIPIAALYAIFQAPLKASLKLPEIAIWPLILIAVLTSAGLAFILPPRHRF